MHRGRIKGAFKCCALIIDATGTLYGTRPTHRLMVISGCNAAQFLSKQKNSSMHTENGDLVLT